MTPVSLMRVATMVTRRGQGRAGQDSRGLITALSIGAYAVVQALALAVSAGVLVFLDHAAHPSSAYQEDFGGSYVSLAIFAGIVLVMPLVSLCVAAARMGALRRARRLSIVRMLGAGPRQVRMIGVIEAFGHALAGVVIGTALYLVSLPAWSLLRFEGQALSASSMWIGPVGLVIVSLSVLVIATVSAVVGLQRVVISPLGVARRTDAPAMRRLRVIIPSVLVVGWVIGGQVIGQAGPAVFMLIVFAMIAALLAGIDAVGPFLVQGLGRTMVGRARDAATLIAGRRLIDDPKSTWRAVGSLSMVCFLVSFTAMLPALTGAGGADADQLLLMGDIRNGVWLTLAIAFVLTAASTGLNQAAKTLDRIGDARTLAITGAPAELLARVRRREVLAPVGVAVLVPTAVGLAFQFPIMGSAVVQRPDTIVMLVASLAIGVLIVFAAQEMCRFLQARLLAENSRRAD